MILTTLMGEDRQLTPDFASGRHDRDDGANQRSIAMCAWYARAGCRPVVASRLLALTLALVTLGLLSPLASGNVAARDIDCGVARQCVGTNRSDTIRGAGDNAIRGKGGNDRLTSAGNSDVDGGPDNDRITAGVGFNHLLGGTGNDVIDAANGAWDAIACGPGKDTVTYDAGKDVLSGCETKHPR